MIGNWNYYYYLALLFPVVFFALFPSQLSYFVYLYEMATFRHHSNAVFPFTYLSAVGLFIFALWSLRYYTSTPKAFLLAIPFPFAATSLFEQTYQTLGWLAGTSGPTSVSFLAWGVNLSFIIAVLSSASYWRFNKYFLVFLATLAAGFLVWYLSGFPQIYICKYACINTSRTLAALAFNIPTKVLSYCLFATLIAEPLMDRFGKQSKSSAAHPPLPRLGKT